MNNMCIYKKRTLCNLYPMSGTHRLGAVYMTEDLLLLLLARVGTLTSHGCNAGIKFFPHYIMHAKYVLVNHSIC
jgi:hypothetical protein